MEFHKALKKLNIKTRNKVRALLFLPTKDAFPRLNALRNQLSGGELAWVDRVFWQSPTEIGNTIPDLFPQEPQISENFYRLVPIELSKQLDIINSHAATEISRLLKYLEGCKELNSLLLKRETYNAAKIASRLFNDFGYSHHLLRKIALLHVYHSTKESLPEIEEILISCGSNKNKIITASLIHCYQDEQDFLAMKRSIMNLPNRGDTNRFTRDMARIPFHPHHYSDYDFRNQLQSSLQSSLIDAIVLTKFNDEIIDTTTSLSVIGELHQALRNSAPTLDEIAASYSLEDSDCEHLFYKHSSAWLEVDGISSYRRLLDNFYDTPESPYITLSPGLFTKVTQWTGALPLNELAIKARLTNHQYLKLQAIEKAGTATRTALFNLSLHKTQGHTAIDEISLVELMGLTRDLNKTIPVEYASNLAKLADSNLSKLILYLLIAKKSRNERDDHLLRRVLQQITVEQFNGNLIVLLRYLYSRSQAIAKYAYEIFTEDFIAKLFQLVSAAAQITETRAALHNWMGQMTGEKIYLDRARTLLIDHQINKIRNELDDNRIYVDVARFYEWFDDEMLGEVNAALSALEHKNFELENGLDSVLRVLIERCYETFCSHKVFGVASYLGRRIRHGTFKGHLFSNVVAIERDSRFSDLLQDSHVRQIWDEWKSGYESTIDEIIRDCLHVASKSKTSGLLNPGLNHSAKLETLITCIRHLCEEYSRYKTSLSAKEIVTESCWRMAEVDLKIFGAYLKHQRNDLINAGLLNQIRQISSHETAYAAIEFVRDIIRHIDEKLMAMQNWFQKPLNVAPKASLSLLFNAVVAEVRDTYPQMATLEEIEGDQSIQLMGGAYHVIYDAFYVVVYNAAKHGKLRGKIASIFSLEYKPAAQRHAVIVTITSELRDDQSEEEVQEKLQLNAGADVENAQMYENRSGIPKLFHLQEVDQKFRIEVIQCKGRLVYVTFSYLLEN